MNTGNDDTVKTNVECVTVQVWPLFSTVRKSKIGEKNILIGMLASTKIQNGLSHLSGSKGTVFMM